MSLAVIALALLLQPQSTEEKVRALVEKLESGDVAEREKAGSDLVKSGPKILPFLRPRLERLSKEGRILLEGVIQRIEQDERIETLMAPAPTVTLNAKDRPVEEVLAELRKQSGVIVEPRDLSAGVRVSVCLQGVSIWAAIDELCRAHGRLMYSFGTDRIVIREGAYRKLPAFDKGPYRFLVDAFEWSVIPEVINFDMQGGVLAPPGRFPDQIRFVLRKFEDPSGLAIPCVEGKGLFGEGSERGVETGPPVLFRPVSWFAGDGPALDAASVKTVQGEILLDFAAHRVRRVSVKNPLVNGDRAMTRDDCRLCIHESVREGPLARLRISYERPLKPSENDGRLRNDLFSVALYDAAGRRLRGLVQRDLSIEAHEKLSLLRCTYAINFLIPEGFAAESLDLEEAVDFDTIRVPFRLDDVPLR